MSTRLRLQVRRLASNPIIRPDMDDRMGGNINGPSLLRVPAWLSNPLGRYYLYFADHKGAYIRLAYADALQGPWKTYLPGSLQLADSLFPATPDEVRISYTNAFGVSGDDVPHIASPDVHADDNARQIRMYFHGMLADGNQMTRVALSADGIRFKALPPLLGAHYFRVFQYGGMHYALCMPGAFHRSPDGLDNFEAGPVLFDRNMRHCAVQVAGKLLRVFYTNAGDCPERIMLSTIDLSDDWRQWRRSEAQVILEPETGYEGADLPLQPSLRGAIRKRVRQLRDPAVFVEDDRAYLLYSVAGEAGIAIAELDFADA